MLKKLPVTYCRFGCGNNIHIKCMKVWADHQRTNGATDLKCPLCRENFGTFQLLDQEYRNNELFRDNARLVVEENHYGFGCNHCKASSIVGKCYKCTICPKFHLCAQCFGTQFHAQHAFLYRETVAQKFRPVRRDLPQMRDIVNSLFQNEPHLLISDESNQSNNSSSSQHKIPEKTFKAWPSEKVRENSPLLSPGIQCRVCLRAFHVNEIVKRLPTCKHKFHATCIDEWLKNASTCPVDGANIVEKLQQQQQQPQQQQQIITSASEKPPIVEGATLD